MSRVNFNLMSSSPNPPASGKSSIYSKNGKMYSMNSSGTEYLMSQTADVIQIDIGDGTNVISTGTKQFIQIPFDFTITAVRLLALISGAIVIDIWKDTYANFPPVDADSITSATPPTITATGQKSEDTTLSGWTKNISAGDILGFNVDSCSTITKVTVVIIGKQT
jgi:hypothetical protein